MSIDEAVLLGLDDAQTKHASGGLHKAVLAAVALSRIIMPYFPSGNIVGGWGLPRFEVRDGRRALACQKALQRKSVGRDRLAKWVMLSVLLNRSPAPQNGTTPLRFHSLGGRLIF